MALPAPANANQRRQRVAALLAVWNASDQSTFDLLDWFYGPTGPGAAETDTGVANMTGYYGVPSDQLSTIAILSRSTPAYIELADGLIAAGFWTAPLEQRAAIRWRVIIEFINRNFG
jgi:hypothetical protein